MSFGEVPVKLDGFLERFGRRLKFSCFPLFKTFLEKRNRLGLILNGRRRRMRTNLNGRHKRAEQNEGAKGVFIHSRSNIGRANYLLMNSSRSNWVLSPMTAKWKFLRYFLLTRLTSSGVTLLTSSIQVWSR